MKRLQYVVPFLVMTQILLTSVDCHAQSEATDNKVAVSVEIIARGISSYFREKNEGYFVRATVLNTQDTTIRFVIMSCGWPGVNCQANNKFISLAYYGCDANHPEGITLKPKQSIVFNAFIEDPERKHEGERFRLGFRYYSRYADIFELLLKKGEKSQGYKV